MSVSHCCVGIDEWVNWVLMALSVHEFRSYLSWSFQMRLYYPSFVGETMISDRLSSMQPYEIKPERSTS